MRSACLAVVLAGCFAAGDPTAMLAERAPDAVDCGAVEAWDREPPLTPGWARVCALAARGRGQGFRATVSQGVADGADIVGWIGNPDGSGWHLHYTAAYAMGIGPDTECVQWTACAAVVDRGPACGDLDRDLCFKCQ